jgi:putative hydrolase of the HAD superfamily
MYKLYIFDMGGVVAGNTAVVPYIAESLGIGEAAFFQGAGSDPASTQGSPYHRGDIGALMRGDLSTAQFWRNFTQRTGIAVSGDPWGAYFHPELIASTVGVIRSLRDKGQRVVCGTNTLDAHYRIHRERGDYDLFHFVYASHLMGVIKPDPAFWQYILEAEGVAPTDAFFVDDYAENVDAAARLGLGTYQVKPVGLNEAAGANSLASAISSR